MAKFLVKDERRDANQKRIGCISASMMAHVGVLAVLALSPNPKQPFGEQEGNGSGIEMNLDSQQIANPAPPAESQLTEVMLADSADTTSVPVAEEQAIPVAQPEPAKTLPAKVLPVKSPKAIQKVAAIQTAPKDLITDSESEMKIEKALEEARKKQDDQTEEELKPLVAADSFTQDVIAKNEEPEAAQEEEVQPEALPLVAQPEAEKFEEKVEDLKPQTPPVVAAAIVPQKTAPTAAKPMTVASNDTLNSQGLTSPNGVGNGQTGRSMGGGNQMSVPMGVQIRDASELVAQPGNPSPRYPEQDRLIGKQGTAIVVGNVRADGSMSEVFLERGSGSKLMDDAAVSTFAKWKFMPGQQGLTRKRFQFQLTGEAKTLPARLRR